MEKRNRKLVSTIISKTIVFIFVVLFVSIFKVVFGPENSLVGVTTIVLTLALLERDLTGNFLKNIIYLIVFNLILGLGSFVTWQNIWIGVPINFTIMLLIGYSFSYELRKSLNMLVGLHYILLVTSPVTGEQLPMRLIALVSGACIIMIAQALVNKNKLAKSGEKELKGIEEKILKKLYKLKKKKDVTEINSIIERDINKLKFIVWDSSKENFSITEHGKAIINVLSCLEQINILLDNINEINEVLLNDIYIQLTNVKDNNYNEADLEVMISRYKNDSSSLKDVYKFAAAVINLNTQISKLQHLDENKKKNMDLQSHILDEFRHINIHRRNFTFHSNRVAYGIRLGLLVAITTFITNYFKLQFGNWMVYTVFALTQPYAEFTRIKSKKRIVGTVIGAIIIFILFNIVKDQAMRTVILLVTGYLMGYVSDYRNIVIFVTITSISSVAINVPNPNYIIMSRVVFIIIGLIISLVANKLILHRTYKDEETNIVKIQNQIYTRILKEVLEADSYNENSIGSLYLIQGLVENRVENLNLNIDKDVLYKNRMALNCIHQRYLSRYESL